MKDEPLKVDITFADEVSNDVVSAFKDVGAQNVKQVSQRGLAGIEIVIVGTIVASGLANLVIRLAPKWKCGVVVDARGARVLTKKDCELRQGTVLVISPKGIESKLEKPSELQIKSLIEDFAKGKS